MKKTILFCLPYAGGSTTIYSNWKRYLDDSIELYPIELAGRGKRAGEPLYCNFEEAVNDIYNTIRQYICTYRLAFFGHSMGSWLVFELCHKLQELDGLSPFHIFFSGMEAPITKRSKRMVHSLEDDKFRNEIIKLGGTPQEIFDCKALFDFFIPVLRADFRIVEMYHYRDRKQKLNSKVTIFYGKDDDINLADIFLWNEVTNHPCDFIGFNGGHFFINDNIGRITNIVNQVLI